MLQVGHYLFKRADANHEFEQIHRLNYRTFVEEIPQHAPSDTGRLVDKFHHKNTYFIVVRDEQVVGMVSVHGQTPFSVAGRRPDPEILERPGCRPLEVRLLAIEPQERSGNVLIGLLWMALEHARNGGFTDVYISGVADRVEMYRRIGFEPLGPAVSDGTASFVPMKVSFPLEAKVQKLIDLWTSRMDRTAGKC
jgi:predicted N-acetyltransferase YhbS